MLNGGVSATPSQATIVQEGSQPGFVLRNDAVPSEGAQIYCAVVSVASPSRLHPRALALVVRSYIVE